MSIVRRRAGGSVRRPIVVALLVHLETHAYQRPPLSQRPRAPAPRAWADDVVAEFAGGARDGRGDVARASRVREALEALKAPLAPAWDNDECVALGAAASGRAFDGWFSLDDLLAACDAGEVVEAGRGVLGAGGAWQMARVGARGAPVSRGDVAGVLDARATCVLNSLDATCPRVAALSLAAIDAFGLPVCVNLYATGAGARVSAPPHTDTQRVLVMQCHGNKRWRVWRPPRPDRRPGADPLARGKGDDVLELGELDESPAADVVLGPGDCLYVPAGWPHTTDTLECAVDDEPSVHLTLGVDTHIWGLDGLGARAGALALARKDDALAGRETAADPDRFWGSLRKDLPALGWRGGDADDADRVAAFVASTDAALAAERATCGEVAARALAHGAQIAAAIRGLYADVVFHTSGPGASPAKRSAPHFARLEATMESLLRSYRANAVASKFAVGDAVLAPYLGTDDYEEAVVDNVRVDGRLDVVFLDGDFEQGLDPAVVAPKKKKKKKAKTKLGGLGGAAPAKKKKKVKKR